MNILNYYYYYSHNNNRAYSLGLSIIIIIIITERGKEGGREGEILVVLSIHSFFLSTILRILHIIHIHKYTILLLLLLLLLQREGGREGGRERCYTYYTYYTCCCIGLLQHVGQTGSRRRTVEVRSRRTPPGMWING